jgi:hypothetical protein
LRPAHYHQELWPDVPEEFEPMPVTSAIEDVAAFFDAHEKAGAVA